MRKNTLSFQTSNIFLEGDSFTDNIILFQQEGMNAQENCQ